jgi:non-ribosomal peptide synthase protein (TIGR01720 family)
MLKLHRLADPARLAAVVCRLVEHHDALRLRFVRDGAMWRQHNARPDGSTPFAWVDLASLPAGSWLPALEEAADQVQRSLNLTSGPLIRAVLFDLDSRSNARLLLAVHHLVVDGVSWRILLEDLERSYQQLANFRPIDLPPKGTSFQRWAQRLCDRAGSEEVESQLVFWLRVPEGRRLRLALDHPLDDGPFAIIHDVVVQLEPHATYSLIQEAPKAYHTQLEDLLLTALVRALRARFGDGLLLLDLERHGRESIFPDVDVSRTIGWFTTIFPVWLGATTGGDFERDIKLVKEQLRAVSSRGIDFGALRCLSADESVRESLRSLPTPELRFNYLGRLDGVLSETSEFLPAAESRGTERSPRAPSRYLLDLVVWVSGDRLQVSWNYDGRLFRRETVEALAQGYVVELRALIEHCRTLHTAAFTPSDFPEAGLTQETLDTLMQQLGEAGGF